VTTQPTTPGPLFSSGGASHHQIVYTIVERTRDRRKVWVRIGAAFRNQDGSTNVYLDAVPTNGQLQIRDPRGGDQPATRGGSDSAGDAAATRVADADRRAA